MSHLLNFVNTVDALNPFTPHGERNMTRFLDMFADTGTAILGYDHSLCSNGEALNDLEETLAHLPLHVPHVIPYKLREKASTLLCEQNGYDKIFWSCSGEQAVEAMLKFARKATGRTVWAVPDTGQFHGRTYGAMSVSVQQENHISGHQPLVPGVMRFTDPFVIDENVACVILTPGLLNKVYEPYQKDWVQKICSRAKEVGALVCFDETQTHLRLGRDWGYELYDIDKPDMICTAKGIAGGIPCGVTFLNDSIADKLARGGHFNTFGASPRACAGAIYVAEHKEELINDAVVIGEIIFSRFREAELHEKISIGAWHSDGAMHHIELPGIDPVRLVENCAYEGVLVQMPKEPVLKLTPPLMYSIGKIEKACDIIINQIPKSMKEEK